MRFVLRLLVEVNRHGQDGAMTRPHDLGLIAHPRHRCKRGCAHNANAHPAGGAESMKILRICAGRHWWNGDRASGRPLWCHRQLPRS